MTLSVALCTYNGEAFLKAQLESLKAQRRRPDELIVCDDGSSDKTLSILEDFADSAPFPVRIERNEANLGFARNFEKALGLCRGDVLAPCDQDDVWLEGKLEALERELLAPGAPDLVFSDADVVDESLNPLRPSLWDCVGFGAARRRGLAGPRPWEVLIRRPVVTGCCLMLRKALVRKSGPIPHGVPHDVWLALNASLGAGIRALPERLLKYRVHGKNVYGLPSRDLWGSSWLSRAQGGKGPRLKSLKESLAQLVPMEEALAGRIQEDQGREALAFLRQALAHRRFRLNLPPSLGGRIFPVAAELVRGAYFRNGGSLLSAAADLLQGSGREG